MSAWVIIYFTSLCRLRSVIKKTTRKFDASKLSLNNNYFVLVAYCLHSTSSLSPHSISHSLSHAYLAKMTFLGWSVGTFIEFLHSIIIHPNISNFDMFLLRCSRAFESRNVWICKKITCTSSFSNSTPACSVSSSIFLLVFVWLWSPVICYCCR